VGGDEIDNAGGVDEATEPAVPSASPRKNDEQDQHGEAHPHRRDDRAFHLQLLKSSAFGLTGAKRRGNRSRVGLVASWADGQAGRDAGGEGKQTGRGIPFAETGASVSKTIRPGVRPLSWRRRRRRAPPPTRRVWAHRSRRPVPDRSPRSRRY